MQPLQPGDIIYIWHDSGTLGARKWLGKVIRVNRKTVTCLMEYRDMPARIPIHLVALASDELAKAYRSLSDSH